MVFASCANEDVAQNTTGTEGDNDKNLTTFVAGDETKTRTSMDYNSGNFYWEAGDYIYVKDDDGVLRKSTNAPDQKVASFKYMVPGKFTASSSYKVYYLGKNSNGNSVTISTVQTQIGSNNTEHFGTSGDYGTATATKAAGKNQFEFELEHQAAYLVFQPYTDNIILKDCYLIKIEVSSDNDIAETYTVNPTTGALDPSAVTDGNKIVLTTSGNSSNPNDFSLSNSAASVTTNGAYMVIKPGTHILKVRYWVNDAVTGVEGTITKTLPAETYKPNTYYDMVAKLDVKNYDGDHYYMWDAREQYWKGYEWTKNLPLGVGQPTLNWTASNGLISNKYAQSSTDNRWYHENAGSGRFDATQSCASLPNANEMSWYAMYGDPHWDANELWTTMGHLYKGGMWFKKKSVLLAEGHYNTEISANGTTDMRTEAYEYGNYDSRIEKELPSTADASKYFYLPALGYYSSSMLIFMGISGSYWSSSVNPWSNYLAYYLDFYPNSVGVHTAYTRDSGIRIESPE